MATEINRNLRKEEVVGSVDPSVVADTSHGGQVILLKSAPESSEAAVAWNRTVEEIRREERRNIQAVERMIRTGDPLTPEQRENEERTAKILLHFPINCTMGTKGKGLVESHDLKERV